MTPLVPIKDFEVLWIWKAYEYSRSPIHVSIYMDLVTEHGYLPAFLSCLTEDSDNSYSEIARNAFFAFSIHFYFPLFHKAFTNIGFFQWRVSEVSKEVMSLKDLNGDQREVSNISCCIGLGDHWIRHEITHSCILTPSFCHSASQL